MIPLVAILSTIDTVLLSALPRRVDILLVERRTDGLERSAELGPQLPVLLTALDVLTVCFQG